jgi:hypothetical protein
MKSIFAVLLLAVYASSAQAQGTRQTEGGLTDAMSTSSTAIKTRNDLKNASIWVTVQDWGRTANLAYGCVKPGRARQWTAGGINIMSMHYLRAQVMEKADCTGKQYCDTVAEAPHGTWWTLRQNKTNPSKCYWDETPREERRGPFD